MTTATETTSLDKPLNAFKDMAPPAAMPSTAPKNKASADQPVTESTVTTKVSYPAIL
jgi:hypothetical protein